VPNLHFFRVFISQIIFLVFQVLIFLAAQDKKLRNYFVCVLTTSPNLFKCIQKKMMYRNSKVMEISCLLPIVMQYILNDEYEHLTQ